MAIPDFQTLMLPVLKHLSDGSSKSTGETFEVLANEFKLTENERRERLPSGQQPIFTNRIAWAKAYLKKAGLIESPKRGYYKITSQGLSVLKKEPNEINKEFLTKFKAFKGFIGKKTSNTINELSDDISNDKTPEEYLEYGYLKIRDDLASEILNNVPQFFLKN